MKNKILSLCILGLTMLSSCEEVIEIELKDPDPMFVIEGMVSDGNAPVEVRISQTKKFYDDNSFQGVSGAVVWIGDDAGNQALLAEISRGIYQSLFLRGIPGRQYFLRVSIQDQLFTSSSTMPFKVPIDTLYTQEKKYPGKTYLMPFVRFQDPPETTNFYRFRLFINGDFVKTVDVEKDEFKNGLSIQKGVYYFGNEENETTEDDLGLKRGDTLTLEMQCIDREVFNFFFSLQQTLNQDVAAPGNPIHNLQGGALGYFSAYTSEKKTLVVE